MYTIGENYGRSALSTEKAKRPLPFYGTEGVGERRRRKLRASKEEDLSLIAPAVWFGGQVETVDVLGPQESTAKVGRCKNP